MKVANVFVAGLVMVMAAGLAQTARGQIFENATRTDGQPGEGAGIVELSIPSANGGKFQCTAFFLKNRDERPILMTARHCSMFKLAKSCKAGIVELTTQAGSFKGTCKRSLIENREFDETVIEAEFPEWETQIRPRIAFFSLSAQHPQVGTHLVMMGYPADSIRHGHFTVTRNCWISSNRMVSVNDYPEKAAALTTAFRADWSATKVVIRRGSPATASMSIQKADGPAPWTLLIDRFAAYHNCSVYGGNSGGPIAIEGTRTVLGLPTSFFPDLTVQPQTLTTSMDSTADFIARNSRKFRSLGIDVVEPYAYGN